MATTPKSVISGDNYS